MLTEIDPHNLPPFPKRIPEKLKAIRERLGMTPDQLAPFVGAKTGAEIVAYENDEDDLLVSLLFGYAKMAGIPVENIMHDDRDLWLGSQPKEDFERAFFCAKRALAHLKNKNHDFKPLECDGCKEIALFLTEPGYRGD